MTSQGDTLTLNDSKVKELVESTKTEILSKVTPSKQIELYYNLEASEVLSAQYGIAGAKLGYSTFVLSAEHDGQYNSHFVHIPLY